MEQFLQFWKSKVGSFDASFISAFCVFAPLFTYFIPCTITPIDNGNSLANKTFRTPGFLRWIPACCHRLPSHHHGNVNRWTIATVNHPGTEAECRRELTMEFMDEISIFHNGIDTGNGGREVSVIVDNKRWFTA